jgi:hypothetical protein
MTAFDDESFLADVKSSITAVPSLLKQWLDGFKDPVDRAKVLLTRCKRASLLFRAGDDSYDAERRELRHLLIREIKTVPTDATDVTSSTRLQLLDSALDTLMKNGVRLVDINQPERDRWYELAFRFIMAVESIASRK